MKKDIKSMNIKQVVLPDGSIGIEIDDGSKPNGFVKDLEVDSVKSEVPKEMIEECERLSQDGELMLIFDKYTSIAIKSVNSSVEERRDLKIDGLLSDEYYIAGVEEFDSMPSRFSFYDTETKMTCRWKRYNLVRDFFIDLGFTPGLANLGPEFEQSFILSIQNQDEDYKCILRLQPNLTLDLISESIKTSGVEKSTLYCFFEKDKILNFLSKITPDSYKSIIRNIKLEKVLE
jgi:hypothetical protein